MTRFFHAHLEAKTDSVKAMENMGGAQKKFSVALCHSDMDGFSSAVLLCLANKVHPENVYFASFALAQAMVKSLLTSTKTLYVCDLALESELSKILKEKPQLKVEIFLIDHHKKETDFPERKDERLKVVHDENKCSAQLTYEMLENQIANKELADLFLCAAAFTDKLETGTVLEKLNERISLILKPLTAGLTKLGSRNKKIFLKKVLRGRVDINWLIKVADESNRRVKEALKEVKNKLSLRNSIVTLEDNRLWLSSKIINFPNVKIALVYTKKDNDTVRISLRAIDEETAEFSYNIARKLGGNIGLTGKAIGGTIPKEGLDTYIKTLNTTIPFFLKLKSNLRSLQTCYDQLKELNGEISGKIREAMETVAKKIVALKKEWQNAEQLRD